MYEGPGTPMGTFQRTPASYPPHYYSERTVYSSPIDSHYDGTVVKVERYRPKFGPCMWILAVLFTLLIIVLIICLIIFFTWGPAYKGQGRPAFDHSGYKFDMEQPEFVLDRLKRSDPDLCILDTAHLLPNADKLFAEKHIPTSRHFDIGKVLKKDANGQGFVDILTFQNYVRSLGLKKNCHVIFYDHGEAPDSISTATYAWYLFKLHKHDSVSVMNGGLRAWESLTAKDTQFQATNSFSNLRKDGDFEAGWNSKLWLDFESLRDKLNDTTSPQFADVRKSEFYKGTSANKDAASGGRIKGALNAPIDEIISPTDGALKSLPDVKTWIATKNLLPNKATVVYSDSGLQASVLYFVLTQAGWDVKLYNNGWIEWSHKAPAELKELG